MSSALLPLGGASFREQTPKNTNAPTRLAPEDLPAPANPLDLTPAKWIWYPSQRTLQNTVVLFRTSINIPALVQRAHGWIVADSRYRLFVNGSRVQCGPAPSDPRRAEVDPVDLSNRLMVGENVFGVEVLFYGTGEGTWTFGKPGFLFRLAIETAGGNEMVLSTDSSWKALLANSWKPGQYKRWFLRAFQEEFDARKYPYGWCNGKFAPGSEWLPAMELVCPSNKPSICAVYSEYQTEIWSNGQNSFLVPRSIPTLMEHDVPVLRLAESLWLRWKRPPEEYFESITPNAFDVERQTAAHEAERGSWRVVMNKEKTAALTFELAEQVVGWPCFSIRAPEGTIVELLVHEAHAVGGEPLLNTHFHSWTRFICRQGENNFETFDFESCRWIQLHIRNAIGEVMVSNVRVRRREFPFAARPEFALSDPKLHLLTESCVNALRNSAQETVVDGMARERQQYSGDGGHQLHPLYFVFGDPRLPARFIRTFGQGMTLDGYFFDCWPAYDRLARLMERQLGLTDWGPLLDHGVGFNFDCWFYYLYTGDLAPVRDIYPNLVRFVNYLKTIQTDDGLLPVEHIGVPSVWIDHDAYKSQRHKQCAFNLYTAAMLKHALAPICTALGQPRSAQFALQFEKTVLQATRRTFWDDGRGLFVANLPWLEEEKAIRLCDRSLATAVLFGQCPENRVNASLRALEECPPEMGFSYPANAIWRLWALAKWGRGDVILNDLQTRWATMASVTLNRTMQEYWTVKPDSDWQWSHCAVAPIIILYQGLIGLKPLSPAFERYELKPLSIDMDSLSLTAILPKGPLRVSLNGMVGDRALTIHTPEGCRGELVLKSSERPDLRLLESSEGSDCLRYALEPGKETKLHLTHT